MVPIVLKERLRDLQKLHVVPPLRRNKESSIIVKKERGRGALDTFEVEYALHQPVEEGRTVFWILLRAIPHSASQVRVGLLS